MRLRVLVGCWLTAWIGAAFLVATIAPLWSGFYGRAGFELSAKVEVVLHAGELLCSPLGVAGFTFALIVGLLPLRVSSSPVTRWWFGGGAVVAVVLAVLAWLHLETPLVNVFWSLGPPSPFQLAVEARPGRLLAILVFGPSPLAWLALAIVGALWLRAATHVLGRPRAALPVEARRAAIVASFPALLLGGLAFLAGGLGYAPGVVLVAPPAVAAAGTVVIVVYGAALALRLRRPASEDVNAPSPPT